MNIGAIVLAAGASTRMGAPKQLIEFDGKTLLRRAAETALATGCDPVVVVTGAHAAELSTEIDDLHLHTVGNPDWPSGMASSIRVGLTAVLERDPEVEAVMITLCDQPLITGAHLISLLDMFRTAGQRIAAASYNEKLGVPAVFARCFFAELSELHGDAGARKILAAHAEDVAKFPLPAAAIDLDTPNDLSSFSASLH